MSTRRKEKEQQQITTEQVEVQETIESKNDTQIIENDIMETEQNL